jgi:hypothetical protein
LQREKADFEAVRAKLNASKARIKNTGVKLLEEIQPAPLNENGSAELVRKILQKKKHEAKDSENSSSHANDHDVVMTEKKEEVVDYGSMTAAELRNSSSGMFK